MNIYLSFYYNRCTRNQSGAGPYIIYINSTAIKDILHERRIMVICDENVPVSIRDKSVEKYNDSARRLATRTVVVFLTVENRLRAKALIVRFSYIGARRAVHFIASLLSDPDTSLGIISRLQARGRRYIPINP